MKIVRNNPPAAPQETVNTVLPGMVFSIKGSDTLWLRTSGGMARLADGVYWSISAVDKSQVDSVISTLQSTCNTSELTVTIEALREYRLRLPVNAGRWWRISSSSPKSNSPTRRFSDPHLHRADRERLPPHEELLGGG